MEKKKKQSSNIARGSKAATKNTTQMAGQAQVRSCIAWRLALEQVEVDKKRQEKTRKDMTRNMYRTEQSSGERYGHPGCVRAPPCIEVISHS